MTQKYQERILNIENILLIQNLNIDQQALRECCAYGVPDKFRPLVWRLFLDYLPAERGHWGRTLDRQRAHYRSLVENLVVRTAASQQQTAGDERGGGEEQLNEFGEICADHPLALEQHSQWTGYFKDNEMLKQIENDVRRLRPEIDFFQRPTPYPMQTMTGYIPLRKRLNHGFLAAEEAGRLDKLADKSFLSDSSCCSSSIDTPMSKKSSSANVADSADNDDDEHSGGGGGTEKHWEVVERILYIFSKVNAGIRYVQGMNELLGPIYYVFATDSDDEWARHAETDSFYCFQNLMSEMQDIFIRKMDSEHCGIEAALIRLYSHFQRSDPTLHAHLVEAQGVKAEFFAFRWISLLLSQEFSLPDLIALWDHLFASKCGTRLSRVECLCLAMLEQLREELLVGDFPTNLRLLQNFPDNLDVSTLVIRSVDIFDGQTFQELNEKAKNGNNGQHNRTFPGAALFKFRAPLRSLMADTAAKLSSRIGYGGGGSTKPSVVATTISKEEWALKNATL